MATPTAEADSEFELYDEDALELISRVTDLTSLETELDDVKQHIALQRNNGSYQPMKLFRRSNSVAVSDVAGGLWCEQQVEYRYLHPHLRGTREWQRMRAEGRPVQRKTVSMHIGSRIHHEKEVEIHDIPVEVMIHTKEDQWAVDLLNTYQKLALIKQGSIAREIKIFGVIDDTVLSGIIDQVQYCSDELVLFELKTRRTLSSPGEEQKRGHCLQLMLYKCLLDSLTTGQTNYCAVAQILGLELTRMLSPGPMQYVYESGLLFGNNLPARVPDTDSPRCPATNPSGNSGTGSPPGGPITLEQLINLVTIRITDLELPVVDKTLLLQYDHQISDCTIAIDPVIYDESWAMKELQKSMGFWRGERGAVGVDVEESWKCQSCQFSDVCAWRKRQIAQHSPIKKWPPIFK